MAKLVQGQRVHHVLRIAISATHRRYVLAVVALLITCSAALAQTITANITCDNAYSFGFGPISGPSALIGQVENITSGNIFSCVIGPEAYSGLTAASNDFLYIVAYSDNANTQGVLAQFSGGINPLIPMYSGTSDWEVFATGVDFDPQSGGGPTLAQVVAQVSAANGGTGGPGSSVGWVGPLGGAAGTVGTLAIGEPNTPGGTFPVVCLTNIDSTARWMWYNPSGLANPFAGNVAGEFLIFRLPAKAVYDAGFPPCVDPPANLVGWWPLDETAGPIASEQFNGLDGIHQGTTPPVVVSGAAGNGLYFDNTSGTSYVSAPDGTPLHFGTGDFSVDAWVKLEVIGCESPVVSKGASYFSAFEAPSDVGFEWGLTTLGQTQYLALSSGVGQKSYHWHSGGPSLDTFVPEWHHLAVTVDRTSIVPAGVVFYVDGVVFPDESGTAPISSTLTTTAPFLISKFGGTANRFSELKGIIDEVEVFNRALSASEVQALFQADAAGKCKVRVQLPDVVFCAGDPVGMLRSVSVTVTNNTTIQQCYHLSCSPLPAGAGCTVAGPTVFQIPAVDYCVAPGQQLTTTIQVGCPPGLGVGTCARFRVDAINPTTDEVWSRDAHVARVNCPPWTYWTVIPFPFGRFARQR